MRKMSVRLLTAAMIFCMMGAGAGAKEVKAAAGRSVVQTQDGQDPQLRQKDTKNRKPSKNMADNANGYQHNSRYHVGYNIKKGIDVSKHQGVINWNSARADGVEFAFIRVGFRGYGAEGTLNPDPACISNLNGALSAGIPVGIYFFSQATTTAEAVAEANYALDLVRGYPITLPVAMDYEFVDGPGGGHIGRLYNAHLSSAEATNVCRAFCSTVAGRGYTPMVYANKDMLTYNLNASAISCDYPIWLAHYVQQSEYQGDYNFWQFRSNGTVAGISESVDIDFWYEKIITKYNIAFVGNGETSGKMKPMEDCEYGQFYELRKNKFKKNGYAFRRWNRKKNGSGESYKDGETVQNLTEEDGATVKLYAEWKIQKYSITYILGGGKNAPENPKNYTIKTKTIKLKPATRTGYLFEGWYTDKSYKKKVTSIKKGSYNNIKLYAKWKPIRYMVIYEGNGADKGSMAAEEYIYDRKYRPQKNKYQKEGYDFVCWNTKKDGSGKSIYPDDKFCNLAKVDGRTVKLYAQWKEIGEDDDEDDEDDEDEDDEDDEDDGDEDEEE